jgi:hypothetical protein
MTSLDGLKQFLTRARRGFALPLISLAVAAFGAQAATFIPDSASCTGGAVSTSSLTDVNGVTGVKIFTTSQCSATDPSGSAVLTLTVSGGVGGSFDPAMVSFPVNFVFTPNSNLSGFMVYTLSLQLNGLAPQSVVQSDVLPGTLVDSSNTSNFAAFNYSLIDTPGMSLDSWLLTLTLTQFSLDGLPQTLTLDVPPNSIDITGPASGGELPTPEPSSLLFLGSGVGLLFLGKRKFCRI